MVFITWQPTTGEIVDVSGGDGPGEYTDDVAPERLKEALESSGSVNEESIVGAIMSIYEGDLSNSDCQVTIDVFEEEGSYNRAIAFVEQTEPEKRVPSDCPQCRFETEEVNEWEFQERQNGSWIYHDWICPSCQHTIHTDLIDSPQGQPTPSVISD